MITSLHTALFLSLLVAGPFQDEAKPVERPALEQAPLPEAPSPADESEEGAKKEPAPRLDLRAMLELRQAVLSKALRLDPSQQKELARLLEQERERHFTAEVLRNGGGPGKADPNRRVRTPRGGATREGGGPAGAKRGRRPSGAPARGAGPGGAGPAGERPAGKLPPEERLPGPAAGRGVLPEEEEGEAVAETETETAADAPEARPSAPGPGPAVPPEFGILGGTGVHPALQGLRFTTVDALLRCLRPDQITTLGPMLGVKGVLQLRQLAAARRMLSPRVPVGAKAGKKKKQRGGGGRKRGGRGGGRGGGRRGGGIF